ncbi:hypothetical protein JHD50_06120 [Sulfurimonas sp. MAG313]|nr:hypothetical protein [Sulfurimonas sp. MAG313]MDF1880886.1 hypothetical protein [Sulfurimonas sp. MAG313]
MDKNVIDKEIERFMRPTVYTGVKPLFLLVEELPTKEYPGDIIDVVWLHCNDENEGEFTYITKFAVEGKIIDRHYFSPEEMALFRGRLALPTQDNLEKMILHRDLKKEIEEVKSKRNILGKFTQKDLENLVKVMQKEDEVFLFKKAYGEWTDPFYDIDIDAPFEIVEIQEHTAEALQYHLKHPKTGHIEKYSIDKFYAYIIGAKADITGLQLKDESYKIKIETLREEAQTVLLSIEWLELSDKRVKFIKDTLPRHPFDEYFKYVVKGNERKFDVPEKLLKGLELVIEKHMPDLISPIGIHYIPIDNLLYLFHEIIPRQEALLALEVCDVINEPSALLLGLEGQHTLPPKFLVSSTHIAYAYKKFPRFIETCEQYILDDKAKTNK